MSTHTLKLPEQLLGLGRRYLQVGRDAEALQALGKLARLGEVPADISEDAHFHLAEIYFRRRKYRKARRHLSAALAQRPDCARYHHLLASCLMLEEEVDLRRALRHYRRAVELSPKEAAYLSDYGLGLVADGQIEKGLCLLRDAVELAPDEFKYVQNYATTLLDAGETGAARRTALWALFRNPGDGRFRKLWSDVRFRHARDNQLHARGRNAVQPKEKPVILSFPAFQESTRVPAGANGKRVLPFDQGPSKEPRRVPYPSNRRHSQS